MYKLLFCFSLPLTLFSVSNAQIAQGGSFSIDRSVTASGGGEASSGAFSVNGTIGQSVAGTDSNNGTYLVKGGFWTASIAPSAASANIEGRILTATGQGIRNIIVTVTDANGAIRTASSGTFGYFKIADLTVGNVYTVSIQSKKYQFDQTSQVVYLIDNLSDLNFVASPN